jgi:hypothetical protein
MKRNVLTTLVIFGDIVIVHVTTIEETKRQYLGAQSRINDLELNVANWRKKALDYARQLQDDAIHYESKSHDEHKRRSILNRDNERLRKLITVATASFYVKVNDP